MEDGILVPEGDEQALALPGYGMPVAESLAFGTPVVIADHPALHEAAEGLMPAIDPLDFPAWEREIVRLLTDVAYLDELRRRAGATAMASPRFTGTTLPA